MLDVTRPAARLAILVACSAAASGCGGSARDSSSTRARKSHELGRRAAVPARPGPLRARTLATLSSPVQLPAATILPRGTLLVMGGLDASDVSVSSIVALRGSQERTLGRLPQALHDAAAVTLGPRAYLFGGGTGETGTDSIVEIDSTGTAAPTDTLPAPASDVGATVIGRSAYVVGGYTGSAPLRTIVAFRPGSGARVVGRLPLPLRYPAVAAVNGRLMIAGGTSGVTAQRSILSFDPASGAVARVGFLPRALTHAAGASLNGAFYVIGGRSDSLTGQTSSILAVDPRTGRVYRAGRLPQPLSDAAAVDDGSRIYVVGGRDTTGVRGEVLVLEPAA